MGKWLVPVLALGVLLFAARSIMPPFVVAAALAYLFSPVVDRIEERTHQRRVLVVGVFFVLLLSLLGLGIWLIEAQLAREVQDLSRRGPNLVDTAVVRLLGTDNLQFMGQRVDPHDVAVWIDREVAGTLGNPADAFHVAERAMDTLAKVVLTLLAMFYLLLDGKRVGQYFMRFVSPDRRAQVGEVAERIHLVLGRYLRGQLYLVGLMSLVTYLVLTFVFHLPYALPISLATGVLEVIPVIGPITAGAIAAVVALFYGGPGLMAWVIVAYFVLRMAEDQLVMPQVVGRAVHLHPLVTIFAVLLGGSIAGVLGAVMAVPTAAAIRVTLDYVFPDSRLAEGDPLASHGAAPAEALLAKPSELPTGANQPTLQGGSSISPP